MYGLFQQPTERDPTTGEAPEQGALPSTSAPSPSGGNANVGAPLPSTPAGPGGGGAVSARTFPNGQQQGPANTGWNPAKDMGTPDQVIRQKAQNNPEELTAAAEEASRVVRKTVDNDQDNSAQIKELQEKIGVTGKSIEQLQDHVYTGLKRAEQDNKISSKHHKELKSRWKNIFQFVGEDEMGLFLIDFGLRAMMAGETMGNMGALGAAGSGALGALQGRRRQSMEDEMAMQEAARKGGIEQYEAESGRMRSEGALRSGLAAQERAKQLTQGYSGEKTWLEDFFKKAGWSTQQIADYFGRADSPTARRQDLTDALMRRIEKADFVAKDPVTGKKYRDFGPEDVQTWVDAMLSAELERSGGALGPGDEEEGRPGDKYIP